MQTSEHAGTATNPAVIAISEVVKTYHRGGEVLPVPLLTPWLEPEALADKIYSGGPILTMDDANPRAEAVAVKAGRIVAVGSAALL